jgi:hypothetical protein
LLDNVYYIYMMLIVRFILTLGILVACVAVISIVWPRFTNKPRPAPLTQIYEAVKQTPLGEQTANVLGVTTDTVPPMDIQVVAGDIFKAAANSAKQKAQEFMISRVLIQFMKQYENLSDNDKTFVRANICQPEATQSAR